MTTMQPQAVTDTSVSSSTPDDTKTVVTSDGARRGKKTNYAKTLNVRVSEATVAYIDKVMADRKLRSRSSTARALLDEQAEVLTHWVARSQRQDPAKMDAYVDELQQVRDEIARLRTQVQKAGITINKRARAAHVQGTVADIDVSEGVAELAATTSALTQVEKQLARLTL